MKKKLNLAILLFFLFPLSVNANFWNKRSQTAKDEESIFNKHNCVTSVIKVGNNGINCGGIIIEVNSQGEPIRFYNPYKGDGTQYGLAHCLIWDNGSQSDYCRNPTTNEYYKKSKL